jgi:hypothetical protein
MSTYNGILRKFLILVLFTLCAAAHSTTFYVSQYQNDSTHDGTVTHPFVTLAQLQAAMTGVGTGAGSILWTQPVTLAGSPVQNAWVGYYTNSTHTSLAASGWTDSLGNVVFRLSAGTYYAAVGIAGHAVVYQTVVVH